MYTPNHNWQGSEHWLIRRQQAGSPNNDDNDRKNGFPEYVLIIVFVLVAVTIGCGICTRINQRNRRRLLFEQTANGNPNPNISRFDAMRPRPGFIPNLSTQTTQSFGVRFPPRARRRPSQASVTSLPVYMENPGAQEVVLLQTVVPKAEETTSNQNGTSANNTATTNGTTNTAANSNANETGNNNHNGAGDIPPRVSTSSPPPNPFREQSPSPTHTQSRSLNPFRSSVESNFTHENGLDQGHSATNQSRPTSPLQVVPEGTTTSVSGLWTHGTISPTAIPLPISPTSAPLSPVTPSRRASQSANLPNP